jgi:hypothetical protein
MFPHSEILHAVYRQVTAGSNCSEIMHMSNAPQISSLFGWLIGLFNNAPCEVAKLIKSDLFIEFHTGFFGSNWSHQIAASSLPLYLFLMTTVHLF